MATNLWQGSLRCIALISMLLAAVNAQAAQVSIAAVVGEDIITTTDVNERRDLVLATAGIPTTIENQQKIMPRIVQGLIDESLQLQEAKTQSLSISDAELATAMNALAKRGEPPETIRDFISRNKLSQRSFENQLRAQLAWSKVVQRKLRRNVTVGKDEVERAQKAAASATGEVELRVQAIEVKATQKTSDSIAAMTKLADDISLQVKSGADFSSIGTRYVSRPNVRYNPPIWVAEKNLPLPLQQALRGMKEGESTPPLRGADNAQIIQLIARKTGVKQADGTEYAVKQIALAVPKKRDKATMALLQDAAKKLRADPGSCESTAIPSVGVPTDVQFVRTQLGAMSPQQRSILAHLEVGDVSEPLIGPDAIRLVVLCEKIEPASGNLPPAEAIRQQLFAEKLELEAQKYLRNLRRDAFIDIKGQ